MSKTNDISILYAARELEQYLQLTENKPAQNLPESGWTLPHPPRKGNELGNDNEHIDHFFNEWNLDVPKIHNAIARAGFDTYGKIILHDYLTELGGMGIATNITHLHADQFYLQYNDPDVDAKIYHIPSSYKKIKFSSLLFKNLLLDRREQDQRHKDDLWYQRNHGDSYDGVELSQSDFEKIIEKGCLTTNYLLTEKRVVFGSFYIDNTLNFNDFFGRTVPEWLIQEVKKRRKEGREFNFLDALAIKAKKNKRLIVTHDYRKTYDAETVLENI